LKTSVGFGGPGDFSGSRGLAAIERRMSQRRLAWLDAHGYPVRPEAPLPAQPVSPRRAYELLCLDYMGLAPEQVPVIEESDSCITWLSLNPCPTLAACDRSGFDTRIVCRAATEKPVQTFLTRLDPCLRFVRDYQAIRPHAPHCREQIVRVDLEGVMRMAIEEALLAKEEGNKGYGAVVLLGDRELARARDAASAAGDPSLHAEFTAIRRAIAELGSGDLTGSLLVSTCEPCPMCAGLAVWAKITTIVFGSSIADTLSMGRTRIGITAAEIAEMSPTLLEVVGGVLREECDRLYA